MAGIQKIRKRFSKVTIKDILQVLAASFVVLLVIFVIFPSDKVKEYGAILGGYELELYPKFILFAAIKEGPFGFIWFLIWPALFYYFVRKKSRKIKALFLILGLMMAIGIYLSLSGESRIVTRYRMQTLYELPEFEDCGDTAYFFFAHWCGSSIAIMPNLTEMENELDFKMEWLCNGNETICDEEFGIKNADRAQEFINVYQLETSPSFVFRCKYLLKGNNVTMIKRSICTLYDLGDKCEGVEEMEIHRRIL